MSVFVVRALIAMRRSIIQHKQLAVRLARLEQRLTDHDSKLLELVEAIRQLMAAAELSGKRQIGFQQEES
jgi:hypothetical protein